MAPQPPPTPPRWPTLGLLAALVLGLHLWLLAGEWPDASQIPVAAQRPSAASPLATPASGPAPAAASQWPVVPPVTVSRVRWITPAPVEPAAVTPAQAEKPAKPSQPIQAPTSAQAAPSSAKPTPPETPVAASATLPAPADPTTPAEGTAPPPAAAPDSPVIGSSTTAPSPEAPVQAASPVAATPVPGAAAQALPPARVPGSTRLAFDVTGNIRGLHYNAESLLDWTVDNGRFDARMVVRLPLVGSRVQTSTGRVDASTGLLPERFADKAREERATHFDHAQQRIRFSVNTPEAELQPGAQDRLSLFMQLAGRFNAAPGGWQAGQVIELQVAGPSDAEPWRFRVGEEETLNLPAGALLTRRLVRELRQPRDSQVELWLAPALEHLPVRIRVVQHNGDQLDQQLSRRP